MKIKICSLIGMGGAAVASFFGGWNTGLSTLIFFMAMDYVTGLIVAGVFNKSTKTDSGALESRAGWKGLCRKCMVFLYVLIAHRLDVMVGTDYIRDMVVIGFAANELISITENAGLMGVPMPDKLKWAIDVLQGKEKKGDLDNGKEHS